jgi:hypothetical protein
MRRMMTWILGIVAGLAVLIALLWGAGAMMPERHRATVSRDIFAALPTVAAKVRAVEAQAAWRSGVRAITVNSRDANGTVRYVEQGSNGEMPFVFRETSSDREFVSTIDTESLPFGGTWTITLTAVDAARTRIMIVEDGVVRAPIFRVLSRYVFGHTSTMDAYVKDLAASFPPAS